MIFQMYSGEKILSLSRGRGGRGVQGGNACAKQSLNNAVGYLPAEASAQAGSPTYPKSSQQDSTELCAVYWQQIW